MQAYRKPPNGFQVIRNGLVPTNGEGLLWSFMSLRNVSQGYLSHFLNKKKRIWVLYLKSCQASIFSHTGERESDQNNRITRKLMVLKGKWRAFQILKTLWITRNLNVLLLRTGCLYLSYFAPHKNFTTFFVYFFVIFWYQFWLMQTSNVLFFLQEGHSAVVRKNLTDKTMPFQSLDNKC